MSVYARILLLIAGYAVTLLLIRWVILSRKREPVAAVAWILAIIFIPILGGVLFLLLGINSIRRRREGKIAAARDLAPKLPDLGQHQLRDLELTRQQTRLAALINQECGGVLTGSNAVEVIADTHQTLRRIEEAILGATQTLDLEFFIWQPDRTGTRLRDMLIERAKAGVKVRFLYDSLGSMALHRKFLSPMTEAGILVVPFLPGSTFRERWSFNNRCHRKIVVVDGTIGFTGGMNIGDEYIGANPDIGHRRPGGVAAATGLRRGLVLLHGGGAGRPGHVPTAQSDRTWNHTSRQRWPGRRERTVSHAAFRSSERSP